MSIFYPSMIPLNVQGHGLKVMVTVTAPKRCMLYTLSLLSLNTDRKSYTGFQDMLSNLTLQLSDLILNMTPRTLINNKLAPLKQYRASGGVCTL